MPRIGIDIGIPSRRGGGFLPTQLAGLTVWLRADLGVTLSGGNVSAWADQSGGAAWTQGTADNQPAAPAAWQGQQAIQFTYPSNNALKDWVDGPSLAALTAGHAFVALELDLDPSTAANGNGGFWTIGTDALSAHIPFTDSIIYDDFGTNSRKSTADPAASMADPCIYEAHSAAGDWANFLSGVAVGSTGTNTVAFSATPRLGADATVGQGMSGKIGEFILYNRKLTAPERSAVLRYLGSRYSIAVTL